MPTNNSAGIGMALVPLRMLERTPGAILQPQPPPCDKLVRRGWVPFIDVDALEMVMVSKENSYCTIIELDQHDTAPHTRHPIKDAAT